jgi:phage terminase small subunit
MTKTLTRGGRWKLACLDRFDYTEPELEMLELTAEAIDRAEAAQREIDEHGVLIDGLNGGPKVNPAVAIRRDAEVAILRYARALGIVEKATGDA